MDERIGFVLYQAFENRGSVRRMSVFGLRCYGWCKWGGGTGLDQGLEGRCGVMSVCVVSPDSLCRWQVQVSIYCA